LSFNTMQMVYNSPFKLQPEDGFMKKAEICHCYDLLTIF